MTSGNSSGTEAPGHALQWRLHTVMSDRGIRTVRELHRRLLERGVDVTHRHLARVVSQLPERLSTQLLLALMVELECKADELLRIARRAPRSRASGPSTMPAANIAEPAMAETTSARPPTAQVPAEEATSSANLCGPDMASLVLHVEDDEA